MKKIGSRLVGLAAGASALILAACGGGGGGGGGSASSGSGGGTPPATPPPPPAATNYAVSNLVSDTAGNPHRDPNLVNGWGISFGTGAPVWIANNGTNTSTLYDGNGVIQPLVVAIPPGSASSGGIAGPTGIVFNGTTGFTVTENGKTGAAAFIFDGEGGTISGWSQSVDLNNAVTVVDNSASGAVYKGLALITQNNTTLLLAANFHSGNVDVFSSDFKPTTVAGGFKDSNLPAGYAPFGIQAIGGNIIVTYAKQDPQGFDEVDGASLGVVDEFDFTGTLTKRLVTGGALNAPWGIALAPSNFGSYSGDLLIGNFGDGKINVFDPTSGAMLGTLSTSAGPIVISGLWGLAFGNGVMNQPTNTLFFTAGPNDESDGLYGRIDLPGTYTPVAPPATPSAPSY